MLSKTALNPVMRFGSLIAALLLTGCSSTFSSKMEAEQACRRWDAKSKRVEITDDNPYKKKTTYPFRNCFIEEETRQWLGVERDLRAGSKLTRAEYYAAEYLVKTRYRY